MLNIAYTVVMLSLAVASVWLWYSKTDKFKRASQLLDYEPHPERPFGLIDVAILFLAWGLGQIGAQLLVQQVLGISTEFKIDNLTLNQRTTLMLAAGFGQLLATSFVIGILHFKYRSISSRLNPDVIGLSLGPTAGEFNRKIAIGLGAFVMILPVVLSIQMLLNMLVPYEHGTIKMLQENFSLRTGLSLWTTAVLIAPFCEEVFFRGLLQGWLQRVQASKSETFDVHGVIGGWPKNIAPQTMKAIGIAFWIPIVVSSAFFALSHLGQGLAPVPLFVFGICLGYLYRTTGSLIPCIVVHFLLNGFTMFWLTLQMID